MIIINVEWLVDYYVKVNPFIKVIIDYVLIYNIFKLWHIQLYFLYIISNNEIKIIFIYNFFVIKYFCI